MKLNVSAVPATGGSLFFYPPKRKKQKPKKSGHYLKWYQFNDPFKTIIDGQSGKGKIFIPKPYNADKMDEKDSTGI